MVSEWSHRKPAGNSGLLSWVRPEFSEWLTTFGKPDLPDGIEVLTLNHDRPDEVRAQGYLCLERERSPVKLRRLRIRELR